MLMAGGRKVFFFNVLFDWGCKDGGFTGQGHLHTERGAMRKRNVGEKSLETWMRVNEVVR